jgi:mono/diheme cytochrome c family protein
MARRMLMLACAAVLVTAVGACGSRGNSVSASNPVSAPYAHGAALFDQHCSGCHTLDVVGAEGSATNVRDKERIDGPNFNVRKETKDGVLFAIRNGGFSGALMPENIVTGADATAIAEFLAKYAGSEAKSPPSPTG